MSGHYCMQRGAMDHAVFGAEPFTRYQAWEWMISEAAWRDRIITVGYNAVHLNRGQLCKSVRVLAAEWKWDTSKVFRFLSRLEHENMISTDSETSIKRITICKYDEYQSPLDASETPTETPMKQQRNSSETTIEEGKELKESKKDISPGSKSKKSAAGPPGFAEWYAAYPHKVDPGHAKPAYAAALKKTTADVLLLAAKDYATQCDGKAKKWIKHPTTWLHGESWLNHGGTAVLQLFEPEKPKPKESLEIVRWRGRMLADVQHDYWDFQNWGDPWNDPRHEVPQTLLDEFPALREKYSKLRLVK